MLKVNIFIIYVLQKALKVNASQIKMISQFVFCCKMKLGVENTTSFPEKSNLS